MAEKSTPQDQINTRLNRRTFLGLTWLAALGALAARFVAVSWQFSIPQRKAGESGGIFDLGSVRDLPEPGSDPVKYPKGQFWLVRTEAGLLAISNICTHLDCLMGWDEVAGNFVCPCHGSQFARDGLYVKGPAPRSLDRFVIQLLDDKGKTVAETDLQAGAPLSVGKTNNSGEIEGTEEAEVADSPYANFTVLVDTGRKLVGPPSGDTPAKA